MLRISVKWGVGAQHNPHRAGTEPVYEKVSIQRVQLKSLSNDRFGGVVDSGDEGCEFVRAGGMAPHPGALQVQVELDLFRRGFFGPDAFCGRITLYRARIQLAECEIRGVGEMLVFIADGGSKQVVVAEAGEVAETGH
ncbi:hypothetical protein CKJ55_04760 [Mycobacterium avium]|uniref:Uncharacterized protein n=1 Tax=Mycobacterium avium subsp. hominissuis TaxID=439334 RepID=A0A3B6XG70_MYCAV|nr:hypothetical protein DFS55_25070 [Mycobacterium avium subsp. hominissuis]KDP11255.1 hypothetical protein MAV100_03180 [Mycobacterium avium subsp. hominissuis 100]PBA02989.1 hypothetical protein CKJ74_02645 [Mycobacterium avium]PBA07897.1 hypothetical protein CKJ73_02650 [Mycobacterium avium]PBA15360.1 hypothetical protein CKJ70_02700 [Mycobacterium avium]